MLNVSAIKREYLQVGKLFSKSKIVQKFTIKVDNSFYVIAVHDSKRSMKIKILLNDNLIFQKVRKLNEQFEYSFQKDGVKFEVKKKNPKDLDFSLLIEGEEFSELAKRTHSMRSLQNLNVFGHVSDIRLSSSPHLSYNQEFIRTVGKKDNLSWSANSKVQSLDDSTELFNDNQFFYETVSRKPNPDIVKLVNFTH